MILEFVAGFVALFVAWVTVKRWTVIHVDRYGRYPPNGWLFKRAADADLERGRRIILLTLAITLAIGAFIIVRTVAATN